MITPAHEIEREEVMAYLDGELSPSRAVEIDAHVKNCVDCAAFAADLRGISEKITTWTSGEPSESLTQNISHAAEKHANKQLKVHDKKIRQAFGQLWSGPWLWRFATVACLAFLVFVYMYPHLMLPAPGMEPQPIQSFVQPERQMHFASAPPSEPSAKGSGNSSAKLSSASGSYGALSRDGQPPIDWPAAAEPMIARSASMNLVVLKLDPARAQLQQILKRHDGYTSEMNVDNSQAGAPSLDAELRVPATQLDAVLAELRALGKVESESQAGEDVEEQHVDLDARLHNARETEQRLIDVLKQRTGKVSDILQVEEQISQTRGEIEQMEAQLATLNRRVAMASIKLRAAEEFRASIEIAPESPVNRMRNAIVTGVRDAASSLLALALFAMAYGPTILLWCGILFWPVRKLWRHRRALRSAISAS